ncbi:MAG: histidine kinase [Proteobacteria bacterium]|nr:histidine kinase [Pseudomonadota bacterium]
MVTTEAPRVRPGELFKELALTVMFSVLIAGFLTLLTQYSLMSNLKYSLSIGLSIHLLSILVCVMRGVTRPDMQSALIAIPLGAVVGITLGSLLDGYNPLWLVSEHPTTMLISLVMALVFGTVISYYFYSRELVAEATAAVRLDALERAAYENRLTESNLRMLQAQIEPHFLFNTLANVLSLIRDEPLKAERMLEDFIGYLRGSLNRTRAGDVSLADELELLRAYLDIQAIRMGERLRYTIDAAPELLDLRLPPMLLQPLVENAIKHGLEPKADGGELTVRVRKEAGALVIEISDTGLGMNMPLQGAPGIGLGNIRDRLTALYKQDASLTIEPNQPHGTKASLTIPLAATAEAGTG